jgi:hypothetical protein
VGILFCDGRAFGKYQTWFYFLSHLSTEWGEGWLGLESKHAGNVWMDVGGLCPLDKSFLMAWAASRLVGLPYEACLAYHHDMDTLGFTFCLLCFALLPFT